MATLQIDLPEGMKRWIESQSRASGFRDASDMVRNLVAREQERADRIAAMQQLVDEARAGGVSAETMSDIRRRARQEAAPR